MADTRARRARRYGVAAVVAVLGTATSFVIWADIARWETRLARSEFDLIAQDRVAVIENRLLADIDVARLVAGFIDASIAVTRNEFRQFVNPILRHQPNIQSVEWVEVVPGTYRKSYEKALDVDGFAEGIRRPVGSNGAFGPAPKAEFYYSVTYVEPTDRGSIPVGFDYLSDPIGREALEASRPTTGVKISMIDSLRRMTPERVMIVVMAVRAPRTQVVRGFVVLVLSLENEVSSAIANLQPAAVSISIFDVFADGNVSPLFHQPAPHRQGVELDVAPTPEVVQAYVARTAAEDSVYYLDTVKVGGRALLLVARPSQAFFSERRQWQSAAAFIAGLVVTFACTGIAYLAADRSAHLEELTLAKESELRASRKFGGIYHSSPDLMASVVDGKITECNDTMMRVLGLKRADLIGTPVEALHAPADIVPLYAAITSGDDGARSTEVHLLRQNGEPIDVLLGVRNVVTDGHVEALCVWRDNTELRAVQSELFQSRLRLQTEERFKLTIESCPTAIIVVNQTGTIVMANELASLLFTYPLDELLGMAIEDLIVERLSNPREERFLIYFSEPSIRRLGVDGGVFAVRSDQVQVPIEIGIAPYENDGVVHAIASISDISRNMEALRMLRDEKDRFEELVANSRTVLWLRDIATGRYIYVSPAYEEMFGRSSSLLLTDEGKFDWVNAIHLDDRQRVADAVNDQEHELDVRARITLPNGDIKHVWARGRPVPNEHGRPERFAGVVEDMTTVMDVVAELERSNEDLERFAYVASHDLQEPLRMISSYVQLLADKYRGKLDTDADEFIRYAVDGAMRMQTLVNDLLVYSRSGRQEELISSSTDALVALQSALANLHAKIAAVSAVVNVPETLPTVRCAPTQMVQLFQNLISNSLKFRRAGEAPVITIACEIREGDAVFTVADNGIGVERSQLERIFQPFTRGHKHQDYEGSGIGLAVCKRIVERVGGKIWVTSRAGAGATMHFAIPLGVTT